MVLLLAFVVADDTLSPEFRSPAAENAPPSLSRMAAILGQVQDPIQRDRMCLPLSALGRQLDAQIPTNARVFLNGMLGPTNNGHLGYYYFLNYYLFPREVAVSVGAPARFLITGFDGQPPASLAELAQAGYDLEISFDSGNLQPHVLNSEFKPRDPSETAHPYAASDPMVAFLLPLAAALAGTRLVRWLFPSLRAVLAPGELLACGLGLGAFFLTQGVLALRLAGLRWEHPITVGLFCWAALEVGLFIRAFFRSGNKLSLNATQLWWLLLLPAAYFFYIAFQLAGVEGLREFDAIAFWALKAKIFHLYAGKQLWACFHNPTFGFAHLDYPLLAPMLHALTYGAIGHINEFVTKFWNQWMLLSLGLAVLGATGFPRRKPWLVAAAVTILFMLPQSQEFCRMEGGTMPLTFFTILGALQFTLGLMQDQPARIRLGLLLFIGAAMVKFEGILLLALWCGLMAFTRIGRAALKPWRNFALTVLSGAAACLPYVVFMLHKPVQHPESGWIGLMLKHLWLVCKALPGMTLATFARRFLHNDFALWTAPDNQHLVWAGHWVGWGSLFDVPTLGLGWVCLLLLLAGLINRHYQPILLLHTLVFLGFGLIISTVWVAAHCDPFNFTAVLEGSAANCAGRYLYPVLISWFLANIIVLARPLVETSPTPRQSVTAPIPEQKPKPVPRK